MRIEIDPIVTSRVGRAMAAGHRITACPSCIYGAFVQSKKTDAAKCFRCGHARAATQDTPKKSWRRCACCGEAKMTGLPIRVILCATCQKLSAKQRRWRRERAKAETRPAA